MFCSQLVAVLKSRPTFKYDGGVNEFDKSKRDIYEVAHVTSMGHLQLNKIIVEPEIALKLAAWLVDNFSPEKDYVVESHERPGLKKKAAGPKKKTRPARITTS